MAQSLQQQIRDRVDVDNYDMSVNELMRMVVDEEIYRAPVYQRQFRWDELSESRLIESLFLGLPVPTLYMATNADGTWDLVDGLQRISTLVHFTQTDPALLTQIGKSSPLKLSDDLEDLVELRGRRLADLPGPLRLTFGRRLLRVTALSDKNDYQVRFDMFDRLNRGGVVLTPQEVRACIFLGEFNDLLRELGEDESFRALVKLQKSHQNDGTREEIVLKFFAYLNARDVFDGAVTNFLNDYMKSATVEFDFGVGRELFKSVVTQLHAITKGPVLRKGYGNTPLAQLEAIMVAAGEIISDGKALGTPPSGWLDDKELVSASTKGTNTRSMLARRIARAKSLLTA